MLTLYYIRLLKKYCRKKKRQKRKKHTIHVNLRHLLLNNGILSSFTDDQISPLYHYNADKESCVTRVLQNLPLAVRLQEKQC